MHRRQAQAIQRRFAKPQCHRKFDGNGWGTPLNGDQAEVIRNAINSSGYPGLTRVRTTKDGADMTVSYGTSIDTDVFSETHTGAQLPVAAYGPRAANVVALTDQTDLFFTMRDALGVNTR
jgi:alkaline phosphatase